MFTWTEILFMQTNANNYLKKNQQMLLTLFLICHAIKANTWLRLICTPKADSVYHFKAFIFYKERGECDWSHSIEVGGPHDWRIHQGVSLAEDQTRNQWTTLFHIQWSRWTFCLCSLFHICVASAPLLAIINCICHTAETPRDGQQQQRIWLSHSCLARR